MSIFFTGDIHKINTFLGKKVRISLWAYLVTGHVLFSMYANLSLPTFRSVEGKWVNEQVIILKEIFGKQDCIF